MTESFTVYYQSNEALGNIVECECRWVPLEEARRWFVHHTTNVCAKMGFTVRVIITDNADFIVAEWLFGKGVTWPPGPDDGPTDKPLSSL